MFLDMNELEHHGWCKSCRELVRWEFCGVQMNEWEQPAFTLWQCSRCKGSASGRTVGYRREAEALEWAKVDETLRNARALRGENRAMNGVLRPPAPESWCDLVLYVGREGEEIPLMLFIVDSRVDEEGQVRAEHYAAQVYIANPVLRLWRQEWQTQYFYVGYRRISELSAFVEGLGVDPGPLHALARMRGWPEEKLIRGTE